MDARIAHHKHDMVVYYDDLGGVVRVTGWEGIMSFGQLQDSLEYKECCEYVDAYPFVFLDMFGPTNWESTHSIKIHTAPYTFIYIKRETLFNKETFHNYMKLIKQSADRLHKIRHSGIQKKAVI